MSAPPSVFDCCDCCDALLGDAEKAAGTRFGQTLCDGCAAEYAEANPAAPKAGVLALYDTLIDECVCGDHNCDGCLQLIDAKLAVAELIAAAGAGTVMKTDETGRAGLWFNPEKAKRLCAALSSAQGGGA